MPSIPGLIDFPRVSHRHIVSNILSLLIACLVLAVTPAQGQIYKWDDENGVTHYSTTQPVKLNANIKRLDARFLEVSRAKTLKPAVGQLPEDKVVRNLSDKLEALQIQVDAERQARQVAEVQNVVAQAAYAHALQQQQASHNVPNNQTVPSMSSVIFVQPPYQPRAHHCYSANMATMGNCWQHGLSVRNAKHQTH